MLARRFLWVIAILIMLVIAGLIGYWLFGMQIMRAAMVPGEAFTASTAGPPADYSKPAGWSAHPQRTDDPTRWAPQGYRAAPAPAVAVFYIQPTSFFDRKRWNGPVADAGMNEQGDKFLRLQASLFNGVAQVWAPRYRQATFGTFLATDTAMAGRALDLAYGDVVTAFEAFIAAQPADRPIILAGHSQGSLHLYRLLKERVAGTPLMARVVAVYAPGWPLSVEADLPALGLPACTTAEQTGCLQSWQSFAEPADIGPIRATFDSADGLSGRPRRGTTMLCTNPLNVEAGTRRIDQSENLGSLVPAIDFTGGTITPRGLGAQCMADGRLSIGEAPAEFTAFILPGNNFHVYDYPLFWANLRADVERRASAFAGASIPAASPAAPLPEDLD
ncbi:hypothetical protein FHS79_003400 [Polymorphobacter multimanifer]|uniref:DUF3089 domain-containing protein n=1 Tax=Polymorphobacter multimanifer TaxID=1070431 RepID=A0A841L859_9SPHN|nr:DUF3089 domain-containing protein [Polymorphobacter multimanifer]MBB6229199.1 hypothetical protein [Polymorphobacter multimanifer]